MKNSIQEYQSWIKQNQIFNVYKYYIFISFFVFFFDFFIFVFYYYHYYLIFVLPPIVPPPSVTEKGLTTRPIFLLKC